MNRIIISFLFTIIFCCILQACFKKEKKQNTIADKEEMIKTDVAFSDLSRQQGMKKAFLEFMDKDGILLRPNHMPIVGADAVDFLIQSSDTSYTLTWEPSSGEVSSSGDMGFTYGVYSLNLPDTIFSGTYVSIWKKQPDGKWKFILDSGNEGIQPDTLSAR